MRCWRGDGLGLQKLAQLWHPGVGPVDRDASRGLAALREARHPRAARGSTDKAAALEKLAAETAVALSDVAYVGNDINDAGCLALAGIPIVVMDAHPDVLASARYRTERPGGFGAVREVCDWIAASLSSPVEGKAE